MAHLLRCCLTTMSQSTRWCVAWHHANALGIARVATQALKRVTGEIHDEAQASVPDKVESVHAPRQVLAPSAGPELELARSVSLELE